VLRSLRNRLILSHILPLIVVTLLTGVALIYLLETRFLLPRLAQNLLGDARLLTEISRAEYELWGNPVMFGRMLDRVSLDPSVRVMFLSPGGQMLYSSDRSDDNLLGYFVDLPQMDKVRTGEEVVLTNYSGVRLHNVLIEVLSPVLDLQQQVLGVVRVTYKLASAYELFSQFRYLIIGVLVFGLLLGAVLGSLLALSISRPVRQVTQAIYDLAQGDRREPLVEKGPEEVRAQIRAVNYLVDRLHNLEDARRQLLANLVHELGRPLGALRSAIQALLKGAASDPELMNDLVTGMDEEADQLEHVLGDLAHLHGQGLGALELNREEIEFSDWLPRTLHHWELIAQEKKLNWQVDLPKDLPVIYADPLRLAQVIGNLVSNAIKYTPGGGTVAVGAGTEGDMLWVKISDTGVGISPDERERIFVPFYRGDQGRRIKQGMGLGLTIARDLAQAHGGRISLDSMPGKGSRFTLWLPLEVNPEKSSYPSE
jgi:two-component system, OmpR family, sensor histidine kinase BaeS